ncbi:hypothetical protein HMPREF9621_02592 [Cutibacterium modestum HL037PA2]|uniref:Uncharacterized protein n=1 Tax=Cutibacterium modestum HL044PA1 TaxID=765109 RepID=A0ABP2K7S5_9ACTN|nr:hypothetical protein HMPREF9621_02584 [Cutibacterium modestum HL037PA2]EFS72984.1 hypothetical protein HMPREF9621_02592 [Cutibacterium modestum HL037PA2]EFS92044.1 hypothetical protein HMPREF9607_01672 [Cutibacterium modestum HL044PA1]EFS92052.1 hypothetical protein HMPREF9607_01680 [Cutibacterium modestum HL044PA1]
MEDRSLPSSVATEPKSHQITTDPIHPTTAKPPKTSQYNHAPSATLTTLQRLFPEHT